MRLVRLSVSLFVLCILCVGGASAPRPVLAQADPPKEDPRPFDAEAQRIVERFKAIDRALFEHEKKTPRQELLKDETYAVIRLHQEKAMMAAKYYRSREFLVKEIEACETLLPQLGKTADPYQGKRGFVERAYLAENDGSTQPYFVYVPTGTPDDAKLPVHVFLHGYAGDLDKFNWKQYMYSPDLEQLCEQEGFLLLMPFGRSNTEFMGIGEADVLKTIELVKRHYNVDANRVFLSGASMGGSGAYTIGCHYPYLFAGIMAIAGRFDYYLWQDLDEAKFTPFKRIQNDTDYARALAANLINTPVFIFHGSRDFVIKIGQSQGMHRLVKELGGEATYCEIDDGDHWIWARCFLHEDYGKWLRETRRNLYPRKVVYHTYTLQYNRAYWVTIERLKRWGEKAVVEATVEDGNRVVVKCANVAALKLSLCDKLVDPSKEITLVVNGESRQRTLDENGGLSIVLEKAKAPGALAKTHEICGPVRDAYLGPILFVVGSKGSEEVQKESRKQCELLAQEWAQFSAGRGPLKYDKHIDEKDIAESNLILVGTPETNRVVERIADKLPIRFDGGRLVVGKQTYPMKDHGLLMVYPNPLNPKRYVLISCGWLWGEHLSINHKLDFVPDYIIYTGERDWDATNRYLCAGYFNQYWQLDDGLVWFGKDEQRAKKEAGNLFED